MAVERPHQSETETQRRGTKGKDKRTYENEGRREERKRRRTGADGWRKVTRKKKREWSK